MMVNTRSTPPFAGEPYESFLAALDAVGGSAGSQFIPLQLDCEEPTYNAVKRNLIATGIVIAGALLRQHGYWGLRQTLGQGALPGRC